MLLARASENVSTLYDATETGSVYWGAGRVHSSFHWCFFQRLMNGGGDIFHEIKVENARIREPLIAYNILNQNSLRGHVILHCMYTLMRHILCVLSWKPHSSQLLCMITEYEGLQILVGNRHA